MNDELIQRTNLLVEKAIGLFAQYVFHCPIVSSEKYCEPIKGGLKVRGLEYHRSISKRYLALNLCKLWDEERYKKKGKPVDEISSIPGAQNHLPDLLPQPEPDCKDGRDDCVIDLRVEEKEIFDKLKRLRNKSIAHVDLVRCEETGKLEHLDAAGVNLTKGETDHFLFRTLEIIDALDHVVRNSGCDWQGLAENQKKIAAAYHGVDDFEVVIPKLNVSV